MGLRVRRWAAALVLALVLAGAAVAEEGTTVRIRTEAGDLVVRLAADAAPVTVANFLAHVDAHGYAGASFYRVVREDNQPDDAVRIAVIQGGLGFEAEAPLPPIPHETTRETGLAHRDGTISMARREPGTASSEFFVCVGDQPELDFGGRRNPDGQGFAAFGRVVEGMDVVRRIHGGETGETTDARGRFATQLLAEPLRILAVERLAP
ncbi:MAG: peptidylprolyl isomerase [Pseudomonadales bacterium]|nr:peptidylprolyl isomerase [Pseudomonadales bacterium]